MSGVDFLRRINQGQRPEIGDKVAVIGGGSVYRELLPFCDAAYITKVNTNPGSDTFFPNLDEARDWYLAETLQSGEENGIAYEMLLYRRKEQG